MTQRRDYGPEFFHTEDRLIGVVEKNKTANTKKPDNENDQEQRPLTADEIAEHYRAKAAADTARFREQHRREKETRTKFRKK